jgi:hypothetical protein
VTLAVTPLSERVGADRGGAAGPAISSYDNLGIKLSMLGRPSMNALAASDVRPATAIASCALRHESSMSVTARRSIASMRVVAILRSSLRRASSALP